MRRRSSHTLGSTKLTGRKSAVRQWPRLTNPSSTKLTTQSTSYPNSRTCFQALQMQKAVSFTKVTTLSMAFRTKTERTWLKLSSTWIQTIEQGGPLKQQDETNIWKRLSQTIIKTNSWPTKPITAINKCVVLWWRKLLVELCLCSLFYLFHNYL